MRRICDDSVKTMGAFGVFPGRRTATIKITQYLENLADVGEVERDEAAVGVLDRLYFAGENDADGVFLIADDDEVKVYKSVRDGFKRVI